MIIKTEKFDESHLAETLEIEKASNSAAWSERSFRNEFDNPHGDFRVAIVRSKVVGFAGVWDVIDEAHVTTIAISPEYRRQGIGNLLMIELLNRARERGMTCSTLEVRESNVAAISLYEALGFKRCAVRKNYYPDNREAAVVMWLHDLQSWQSPT